MLSPFPCPFRWTRRLRAPRVTSRDALYSFWVFTLFNQVQHLVIGFEFAAASLEIVGVDGNVDGQVSFECG